MSTLLALYPKQSPKGPALMLTMCLYSLKNPFVVERQYQEDQNVFVSELLKDGSEADYQDSLSIRSTMLDFVEEAMQQGSPEFSRSMLEQVVAMIASDSCSGAPYTYCGDIEKVIRASINPDKVYVPEGQVIMKQELAFFLIGTLREYLHIQEAHVQQCLSLLTTDTSLILKLRGLWLLEKLSSHD